jgi:hypothetical protein
MANTNLSGQQFEQTALPMPLARGTAHSKNQTAMRATYHLKKDVPLHLQAKQGRTEVEHPSPGPVGMLNKKTTIGGKKDSVVNHPEERMNFPQSAGQKVLSEGVGEKHEYPELDVHGNVDDQNIGYDWYGKHGPQMSDRNQNVWDRHARVQPLNTSTVLHTGQSVAETMTHSFITGPLDPKQPHVNVVVHHGEARVADGHHRLAEARGRGDETVTAHVLNLDQFDKKAPVHPKFRNKDNVEDIHRHLIDDHGMDAHAVERYASDRGEALSTHNHDHAAFLETHRHE